MTQRKLDYYLVALISIIYIIGFSGANILVPLYAEELKASPLEIGIIRALFSILPLLLVIKLGKWVDKIGSKKPLFISTVFGSLSLMIPYVYSNLLGIYILQVFSGISQTTFAVAAQNYMGNTDDEGKRENNIALFSIGVSIGGFFGPMLGGSLSDTVGYGKTFALLGMVGLISAFVVFFIHETRRQEGKKKDRSIKGANTLGLLKISNIRKAFLISALIMMSKEMFGTYFPLLAKSYGISNQYIGTIVSINAAAGIFIRWIMPLLIKKYNRNLIIIGSISLSGILLLFIPIFHQIGVLMVLSFILGMGLGIGQPLSISTTILSLPKNRVGEGLGLRLSVNRLTQVVGPITFGAVANLLGYSAVFWIVGGVIFFGSFKTKIKIDSEALNTFE